MKSKHHALLLIWAINTLLLTLLAPKWWQGLVAGVLIAAAGWMLSGREAHAASTAAASISSASPAASTVVAAVAALPDLMGGVLPAWRRNVELARSQTQEANDRLTQRFVGIHQRLGGVMNVAEGGKNGDVLQVVQNAALQLGGIAGALEEVLSMRDALLRKIDIMNQHNEEIRRLAQEVEQIAGRTGVADLFSDQSSWTDLAARSAEAGRQIVSRTRTVQQQIQTALASANQRDSEVHRVMDDSRAVIDKVIADFRQSALQLSGTVNQLEEENRDVDQEVCEILVNLQFQDRISQILDHVQHDMGKLADLVEQAQPLPDRSTWLANLEKTYTTEEQLQVHAGRDVAKPMQSQVDFF